VSYLTDGCDSVGVEIDGGEFRIKKMQRASREVATLYIE
jgi:hypothetical protein